MSHTLPPILVPGFCRAHTDTHKTIGIRMCFFWGWRTFCHCVHLCVSSVFQSMPCANNNNKYNLWLKMPEWHSFGNFYLTTNQIRSREERVQRKQKKKLRNNIFGHCWFCWCVAYYILNMLEFLILLIVKHFLSKNIRGRSILSSINARISLKQTTLW